ncbi:hypothetical protein PtrEW7m1_004805 [Pyrenophora tritici-repentis]|nr:hypothetical protein PtrEW7m1_004805 [Pyrenophora tritici-repentis]
MAPKFLEESMTLLRPLRLLCIAAYHFVMTIFEVIFMEWSPFTLFNITKLRFKSFARLWKHNGEAMSTEMPGPTFQLLSQCKGVILDIGPGSGEMLARFNPELITAVYGAEPAEDLHLGLLLNAKKGGLGSKFHALLCGAQPESLIPALHKSGILDVSGKGGLASDGIFDEICCTRVLCGVPHPQRCQQASQAGLILIDCRSQTILWDVPLCTSLYIVCDLQSIRIKPA